MDLVSTKTNEIVETNINPKDYPENIFEYEKEEYEWKETPRHKHVSHNNPKQLRLF